MPNSGNPSKDDDTRRRLLDLAVGMRDLADDMADLLPDSPYSMSREQLYLSRTLAGMRSTTAAVLAVLS